MVEFALVLPILLVLLVGLTDLGRVFAAGLVVESAARNAAEKGAQQYVAQAPGPLNAPAPNGNGAYYAAIDSVVAKAACSESAELPNTDIDASDQTCKNWPVIRVCIHDGVDPQCGLPISGFAAGIPSQCADMNASWSNSQNGSSERWVEVRVCYRFTSIVNGAILNLGDVYLERRRQFVIPCYFQLGAEPCG
jgi:hypothetical protein